MQWAGGQLYIDRLDGGTLDGIGSVPDGGGEVTVLHDRVQMFWIEGEHIYFVDDKDDKSVLLLRMPIAGGPVETVFTILAADDQGFVTDVALDGDTLFWGHHNFLGDQPTVWSGSLRDGGSVMLGVLPAEIIGDVVVLADRVVVLDGIGRTAWAVPRQQAGPPQELPRWAGTLPGIIGAAPNGELLWRRELERDSLHEGTERFEVGRWQPGAASVEPFWRSKRPNIFPLHAWADGAGGWYVSVSEWGTDGGIHVSVWRLGPDGNGERLACDPEIGRQVEVGAIAPDAAYVVANAPSVYWEIARVPR